MNEFFCATRILAGEAGQVLSSLKPKRLLVVTDPYFEENGTARRLAEASGAESWELFSEVQPDPPVELAAKATAQLKAFVPDTVAALGGGSAMDCAKAMVYFSGLQPRLIAIPTTKGWFFCDKSRTEHFVTFFVIIKILFIYNLENIP